MNSNSYKHNKIISVWLCAMCFFIVLMIFIGGFTRLTEAGLSITEWNPVSGILPPLNENSWNIEFGKYKNSPEYQNINFGMSLDEFKSIYLIEFIHRIAGRITGLLYIIPLFIFFLKGYIKPNEVRIYFVGLLLFLSQGVMGWYMVKSGLVLDPHVSHYRLAAHLFLAVLLYTLFFWQFMKHSTTKGTCVVTPVLRSSRTLSRLRSYPSICSLVASFARSLVLFPSAVSEKALCRLAIIVLLVQIVLGAFVAGLDAGLIYNQFPLMGAGFIPDELKISTLSWTSFSDPVFVQFAHRMIAYLLSIIIVIFCIKGWKIGNKKFSLVLGYIFMALVIQVLAGIVTLVYNVPIEFALLHQFGAVVLLSCLVRAYFLLKYS